MYESHQCRVVSTSCPLLHFKRSFRDGRIYDCDFNQQLAIPIPSSGSLKPMNSVFDFKTVSELTAYDIATDSHCYGYVK